MNWKKWVLPFAGFIGIILIGSVILVGEKEQKALSLVDLSHGLPDNLHGWKADPEDRFFDDKTIFDYIDGGGEVYRAYNMQLCLARRYTKPDNPAIILDVFDMGSSADAFGVFTHDQEGEAADVGQGGQYRPGWLSFWKSRFFVSVYAEEETDDAEQAVMALGRNVAHLIQDKGQQPAIMSLLPNEGLNQQNIRFLHDHFILNFHYYLSDENFLHLDKETDAALAHYSRSESDALLLLIRYPSESKADTAKESFFQTYFPGDDTDKPAQLENGKWTTATTEGMFLVVILESDSRHLAKGLLKNVTEDKMLKP